MSALTPAWHLAVVEIWFLDAVIHRRLGETAPMPAGVKTGRDVARWYEESFAERMTLLEVLSGEDLTTPVDFNGLRNDPAVAYLNIAIRHSVHHRGQLSAYLRPMGARVPAIYVESADEPFLRALDALGLESSSYLLPSNNPSDAILFGTTALPKSDCMRRAAPESCA